MGIKQYTNQSVFQAAVERVSYAFDNFERVYVSFSGGKDSSVMMHMACLEAIRRHRRIGVLIIDLEAQYKNTIKHIEEMLDLYREVVDPYWVCLPISLRNAVSNFQPKWTCWDPSASKVWVREPPCRAITETEFFPFFQEGMEFEEFMVLFGEWYAGDSEACGMIGIRADESLNRFRTIASSTKDTHGGKKFTTKVAKGVFNVYPIYDWKTDDIWRFYGLNPSLPHNEVYDLMHLAGLSIHQMRLCQPYGDDQRRGLWLYHILEPETWYRVVARVNGVNSGALYVSENGNMTGYNKIEKPCGHTWESFCRLLLSTMPKDTREHYADKFRDWMLRWKARGYPNGIPDEAPKQLENKYWAPSWRRLCKVLLRNDWWCKGLGLTQPKSEAYGRYLQIKAERKGK